jgi:hypothetical protein
MEVIIMRLGFRSAALATLLLAAAPAPALDFNKLDRHIAREPAYQCKPLYGLALIGPDARTRVWMVLDGERLFVDKNCNGDLTDDGPPFELKSKNSDPASFEKIDVSPDAGRTIYTFDVTLWSRPSFLALAGREHLPFSQSVHITFPDGRCFGAWGDQMKPLIFTGKRQDAPVLHFGGDLRMGFEVRKPLERATDGFKLSACVGTPGSCPGAWVYLTYTTIPKDAHPKVVMEFPPASPGGPPVRAEFILVERC